MKNWNYYGVFFDEATKEILLNKAKDYVPIPSDWKIFCHHMTIIYNDKSQLKQNIADDLDKYVGVKQSLKINTIGVSDNAIAFGVRDYHTQNEHSHITVATAPGVKPVESNNIKNWYTIKEFNVEGELNVFVKNF